MNVQGVKIQNIRGIRHVIFSSLVGAFMASHFLLLIFIPFRVF
jgi:hypothetical protein